jgi:hypothetical protein
LVRAEASGQIAFDRLDLHHSGPHVGEEHGRVGGRDQIAELDDEGAG